MCVCCFYHFHLTKSYLFGARFVVAVFCACEFSVPREYRNAILLAVTTTKQCVGINIFNHSYVSDQNGNLDDDFEDYIDRCVRDAADLKISIEAGRHDFENDPRIVKNPKSVPSYVTVDQLLEIRSKSTIHYILLLLYIALHLINFTLIFLCISCFIGQTQLMLLTNETMFMDLGD